MKFYNLNRKLISKSYYKYRIDWDKKERSQFQTDVKNFLRPYLQFHVVFSEFPIPSTRLKIDIFDASAMVCYEIQGEQHRAFNSFFNNGSRLNYLHALQRDGKKVKWCEINNITLCEIYPEDLKDLSPKWFKEKYNIVL